MSRPTSRTTSPPTAGLHCGLALLGSVLLAGCGAGDASEADTEPGDTRVTVLDPAYEIIFSPVWDMPAKFLLFSPLVGYGEAGEYEPRLARSWERSPDGRHWAYRLRTDVRWHDGEPFTARDVAFTIRLLSRPEIGYYRTPLSLEVPDDSTVVLSFERPFGGEDWWTIMLPRHLLEGLDPAEFFRWDFWLDPVGTGPFRWARLVPRTVVELVANPDYFRGRPRIDRLQVKFGGGSPMAELLSGQVDAATYISRTELHRLRQDRRFRVHYAITPEVTWVEGIFWNHRSPLFAEAGVRRALTMAIDRQELREVQNLPPGLPVFDVLFTGRQFWAGELPTPIPFDPVGAARLLDQAGWRPGPDGIRQRDGRPFRFTAITPAGGPTATHGYGQAAVYVQAALRRVGVLMEIQQIEGGAQARFRAGDFEAIFHRFFQPHAERFFLADAALGYAPPRLLELLAALHEAQGPAASDSLHREMWPILRDDVPATFLAPQVQYFVVRDGIRGLSSPFRAHTLMDMEHAWVERP
jgi:ABC-type transport system substrate-binding protein